MRKPSARGWTLVELIMAIVIVGTLAVFVGPVLLNAVKAYDRTQATVGTYAKMRFAMERMAREIGAIRRDPANTTAFQVASMAANNFTFTKEDGTEVALTPVGTTVNLSYTAIGNGTLTDSVTAFSFAYFRHDGATAAANATELEFVEISLTVTDGTTPYANRLRVALRNVQ
jgi:prepilin-type N-terminal cleavage/methylation domain-containing protein